MARKKKELEPEPATVVQKKAPKAKAKPKAKSNASQKVLTTAEARACKEAFFSKASKEEKDAVKARNADIRKTMKDHDLGLKLTLVRVI